MAYGIVLSIAACLFLAIPAEAASALAGPATAPATRPASPLSATLIANQETVTLDPAYAGRPFRDKIAAIQRDGGPMPRTQAVNFTLRISNNTNHPITIPIGGDESRIDLTLAGEGALNVDNHIAITMEFRMGKPTTIAAGKSIDLPIDSLNSGLRGIARCAYFTEPGHHTLTATLITTRGRQQTTITSDPARLTVARPAGK